ncbi:hypothetical protein KY319_01965 [Candidatus Woesearchaeota archaeon]|nr:hypothetical protein [Candidatus Woesearchaeota archaeon]
MGKSWMGVLAIVLIVLAIRLYAAYQTPYFSSDESYLHLRTIETIQEGKSPWHDELGYGGRTLAISPLFDAIIALFTLLIPASIALKIIPNLLAALLVIPVYLIAKKLTKKTWIALFTAIFASIIPEFFSQTFNQITPLTLAIPIFFMLTYAWSQVPQKIWTITFLILLLILSFLHPLAIMFVLSLIAYIILTELEKLKPTTAEYELGLFAIFFTLWAQFLLYKKLILFHGPAVIWQNMPTELLSTFYTNITAFDAIWRIGLAPLTGGMYALYRTAFKKPQKETQLLFGICLVSIILLWFKLVDIHTGFILLGITLTLLFSQRIEFLIKFISDTKISKLTPVIITIILISALTTVVYPAYAETKAQLDQTITTEEFNTLTKISQETDPDAVIIAPPKYGNYITAIAKRKNVIDDYYFLIPQINERYQDVKRLYKTPFETEAVELFDKYKATHILTPPGKQIGYADSKCFKQIIPNVFEKNPDCKIKVVA